MVKYNQIGNFILKKNINDCFCLQKGESETCNERPTTVMRDQLLLRDHCCSNMALHFYTFVPAMKDHLSNKTVVPCGSLSSWVSLYIRQHFLHICNLISLRAWAMVEIDGWCILKKIRHPSPTPPKNLVVHPQMYQFQVGSWCWCIESGTVVEVILQSQPT